MSTHAIEDYFTEDEAKQAVGAAVFAGVTGSVGSTDRREYRDSVGGLVTASEVTVEAIDQIEERNRAYKGKSWGPAYRVTTHQNMVIVLAGRPGRYKSHAA